ncbi:MAG: hypothetical protein J0M10_01520 [Chitinophagales bacterium]|nr:hypothetical protein [Chitinophagales bacterium]
MNQLSPAEYYANRLASLQISLKTLKKKGAVLSWLRLFSFLATIALGWTLWPEGLVPAFAGILCGLSFFLLFVNRDLDNKTEIENHTRLILISQQEQQALQHHYHQFQSGAAYLDPQHSYAHDLDLFGHASLFQYINRTQSEQAGRLLADWLLEPAVPELVTRRQQAVIALADTPEWSEQLQSYGAAKKITLTAEKQISEWMKEENRVLIHTGWKITRFLFPAASLTWLFLFMINLIPQSLFLTGLTFFFAIVLFINKKLNPAWNKLGRISAELESFSDSIRHIENASFNNELLNQQKAAFTNLPHRPASEQIKSLRQIMDRLDYRLNPVVFIPLSVFLCWDLQQVFALEKWKLANKTGIQHWFASLAQTEALASFGRLRFNHPTWVFPFLENNTGLTVHALGHPLIHPGKRVTSDFRTTGTGIINLVTGSNMAGKSTFLRSCGVNIILAMAGAPVCAASFRLSPMRVMSSMRISDNLEESTSTFYAELKKLKAIIDAVNKREPVFLLLDEILRGTNSGDRHTGSKALIKQLIAQQATGIVATHDLELARLKEEYPAQLYNYHFDVQIANEELFFDYKLKGGICRSMNASLLMKKIGINM